jgi:hypothetical protein
MIVIAGDDHDLSSGKRPTKLLEKWTCGCKRIATRTMAQLEHIPQQDESIDVLERVGQRGARSATTQYVSAGAGA